MTESKELAGRIVQVAKQIGKAVKTIHIVNGNGKTFSTSTAAEKKVKELGYDKGSMCRNEPIAIGKNFGYIAKWYNIGSDEYNKIEGIMLCNDWREGNEAAVVIFE